MFSTLLQKVMKNTVKHSNKAGVLVQNRLKTLKNNISCHPVISVALYVYIELSIPKDLLGMILSVPLNLDFV